MLQSLKIVFPQTALLQSEERRLHKLRYFAGLLGCNAFVTRWGSILGRPFQFHLTGKGKFMQKMHGIMRCLTWPTASRVLWMVAMLAFASSGWGQAPPELLRVAAASDLRVALPELQHIFERQSGVQLRTQLGSSGQLAQQIQRGLPVDVFMSADASHAAQLVRTGWAQDAGAAYAQGRLAWLWRNDEAATAPHDTSADALARRIQQHLAQGQRMAIANPRHAPYGVAAQQVLAHLGLPSLPATQQVWGDNVSHAVQFVAAGAVPAALGALPLVQAPGLGARVRWQAVPAHWHAPLVQTMVRSRHAPPSAHLWQTFLLSAQAQAILMRHGFAAPPPTQER